MSSYTLSRDSSASMFHLFECLTEDLKITILSYVADAPFENRNITISTSSLTHSLPLVSRQFRAICNHTGYFWKDAIIRQLRNEPFLWNEALSEIFETSNQKSRSSLNLGGISLTDSRSVLSESLSSRQYSVSKLQSRSLNYMRSSHDPVSPYEPLVSSVYKQQDYQSYKEMYLDIVKNHLRFVGPVFFMCLKVTLGQAYSLQFSEPRYRLLISEVMKGHSSHGQRGNDRVTPSDKHVFIHANRGPLSPTTPATLVQVRSCEISQEGAEPTVHVVVEPIGYVWLEKVWVRPNSGQLYYAQCLRMGKKDTEAMKELSLQEHSDYAMNPLLDYISSDEGDIDDDDEDDYSIEEDEYDLHSESVPSWHMYEHAMIPLQC